MRKKRTKNYYFTKVHENAIIEYVKTNDRFERDKLYEEFIGPAFNEMVDKITYTYKFTNLPNIEYLRDDCKIWLTTILEKYDPSKGHKAFSYFSVITKNWFIHKTKKHAKQARREVDIDIAQGEVEQTYKHKNYSYVKERTEREYWMRLLSNIDVWEEEIRQEIKVKKNKNDTDLKVILAIKDIFNNPDKIEILNKKAIYLYLREMTGLNTKQVAVSLNKIKKRYRGFKKGWTENID
tara:strand:+ start:843 stop:1553 length:711 start_codon:yes stop_codon:yes gene_type:complete